VDAPLDEANVGRFSAMVTEMSEKVQFLFVTHNKATMEAARQLSGGEKALTAVALVFAIFRLNPAPFCLLDEVDAPLDEANVGRFSAMVTEMSEKVQFLFVTHNKATMEAARQLSGVTMREPGVSRLVSVDLAEASRLVGAA
jgi:chromosome segregation protein